ncbi:hypothetical protein HMPREF3036_01642 [Sutterella sp. KLE1602]|nr:hypothetical protein HMPREF3036_01642 [Sutterella sp. KLE1602]
MFLRSPQDHPHAQKGTLLTLRRVPFLCHTSRGLKRGGKCLHDILSNQRRTTCRTAPGTSRR